MNEENLSFDDSIDKMFENRTLNKNPERVIKINNDVLSEITDDRYKRLMTEIITKVKADNKLVERIFLNTPNPLYNIILPPLVPLNYVEFRTVGLADDVLKDLELIFGLSKVHLENI